MNGLMLLGRCLFCNACRCARVRVYCLPWQALQEDARRFDAEDYVGALQEHAAYAARKGNGPCDMTLLCTPHCACACCRETAQQLHQATEVLEDA
jgi:hypothetical protein